MNKTEKEIKPWPLFGYAPGNYMNTCKLCEVQMINVDKLCFICLQCAAKQANAYAASLSSEVERLRGELAEAQQADDWVRVEDRLPELSKPYYDDKIGGILTPVTSTAIVFDGECVFEATFNGNGFRDNTITHWRPLPSPPKQ